MAVTAIRTVIIYIVLIVALRLMGKRQLGDLQPIELVVTLMISDLASVPMQESGVPLVSGLLPIFVLVSLEILLSALMLKSSLFSRWITGTPMVVLRHGQPLPHTMKKLRMTVEDLSEKLRGQGVFDFRDVDTALVETDGSVSVFLRTDRQPAQRGDLPQPPPHEAVPLIIVSDGKPCDWAMAACGWDTEKLQKTLRRNRRELQDIFVMTAAGDGSYTIIPKEEAR